MSDRTCTVVEDGNQCHRPLKSRGMCQRHYHRWRNHGDPLITKIRPPERGLTADERFWRDTVTSDDPEECWMWSGRVIGDPEYPCFKHEYETVLGHRYACELLNGPQPSGAPVARHLCGINLCVNPNHLVWGTDKENADDQIWHGTFVRGEKSPFSKLTEDQVREIRKSALPHREIAATYGISAPLVSRIKNRKKWGWLPD